MSYEVFIDVRHNRRHNEDDATVEVTGFKLVDTGNPNAMVADCLRVFADEIESRGEVSEPGERQQKRPTSTPGRRPNMPERTGHPGSLTSLARLHDAVAAHLADDTADLTELAFAMTEAEALIAERSPENAT